MYRRLQCDLLKERLLEQRKFIQAIVGTVQSGKGFLHDATTPERWGRWVETAIGAHLLCNAEENGYNVYYWRERSLEVDFILQQGDKLVALEVKSGRRASNKGLAVFQDKFYPATALVVGTGGLPIETFLRTNPARLFEL